MNFRNCYWRDKVGELRPTSEMTPQRHTDDAENWRPMKGLLREKFRRIRSVVFVRSRQDARCRPSLCADIHNRLSRASFGARCQPRSCFARFGSAKRDRGNANVEGGGSDHRPASLSTSLDSRPDRGQMFTVPVPSAGRTINSEPIPNRPHVAIERWESSHCSIYTERERRLLLECCCGRFGYTEMNIQMLWRWHVLFYYQSFFASCSLSFVMWFLKGILAMRTVFWYMTAVLCKFVFWLRVTGNRRWHWI